MMMIDDEREFPPSIGLNMFTQTTQEHYPTGKTGVYHSHYGSPLFLNDKATPHYVKKILPITPLHPKPNIFSSTTYPTPSSRSTTHMPCPPIVLFLKW